LRQIEQLSAYLSQIQAVVATNSTENRAFLIQVVVIPSIFAIRKQQIVFSTNKININNNNLKTKDYEKVSNDFDERVLYSVCNVCR
jgi:hypothetical protein